MKLELRPSLKLVISPRLVQLLKFLQLPRLELEQLVRQEMEENPLLEELPETDNPAETEQEVEKKDEFEWVDYLQDDLDPFYRPQGLSSPPPIEETLVYESTLRDHLLSQLRLRFESSADAKIGEFIIDSLDENGYLTCSAEEVATSLKVSVESVDKVLQVVQSFDPLGIAARSLAECLLIQLRDLGRGEGLEAQVIESHLEDLTRRRYEKIAKSIGVSKEEVRKVAEIVASLNPRPARGRWGGGVRYVVPDVTVQMSEDGLRVGLNESHIPTLRVSRAYREILSRPGDFSKNEVKFIKERLARARSFVSSLEERRQTILKVVSYIVEEQEEFFSEGVSHLKPMTLKTVADAVGLHESTVSRVVQEKYVDTPKGVHALKFFFSGAISHDVEGNVSVRTIKAKIKELIESEDPQSPLTDQSIVSILNRQGFRIARRTVSKYREGLGLGSSKFRKGG